jgi:hypothetical protein
MMLTPSFPGVEYQGVTDSGFVRAAVPNRVLKNDSRSRVFAEVEQVL